MKKMSDNLREMHRRAVENTSERVQRLEDQLEDARVERDRALIAAHGKPEDGQYSYAELAAMTDHPKRFKLSKGRVIQIVQPVKLGRQPAPVAASRASRGR